MDEQLKNALEMLDEQGQINTFLELASVHGPSTDEKEFGDYLEGILTQMGFEVKFDDVHKNWEGTCGNMYAYWKGNDQSVPSLLLSAHLDTVLPTENMKPVIEEGIIRGDGKTVLGTDDRSAIAAYVEAVRAVQKSGMPCGPIELFFSVNEHTGLFGSTHMDPGQIVSKGGFNFDHDGDVGQILVAGAYSYNFYVRFFISEGINGHIVMLPDGINTLLPASKAILQYKLGKLADGLYINLGQCNAGFMPAATPEETKLVGLAVALNEADLKEQFEDIEQISQSAAKEYGVQCEFNYVRRYSGYRVDGDELYLKCAVDAAEDLGLDWYQQETCGGGDTNNLRSYGIKQLTLGNGFRHPHNTNDHISVKNLVNTGRYTVALIHHWYEKNKKML